MLVASCANAEGDFGITLPNGYKKIADHRYLSSKGYDETKKELARILQSKPKIQLIEEEINLPHVRSISYLNYERNSELFGINIYLNMQSGLTEIFFSKK